MLPYEFYKVVHFIGMSMILVAFGGLAVTAMAGMPKDVPWRRTSAITHGIGMLLALVGGFGLLARLQIHTPWPGWVYGKLAVWLVFGGLMAVVRRKVGSGASVWWTVIVLAGLASYLARYKPF